MAIEKNSFKGSRFDHEFSANSKDKDKDTTSSDDDEVRVSAAESDDDDDEFDDADSGAGSDDFDLLELGETGAEFCQIGNLTCSVPFELYDLSGLEDILSVDVWNEVLTEDERFSLTKYLPDLDQDTFMRTLKELLEGGNFHFGSPVKKLFEMLKGGLCEPRVALYREGLNFFQKRQHYHRLRMHQNNMVSNFCQMRDAWVTCRGYSIEEKLRVFNIMKSEKSLMYEKIDEGLGSDSSEKEELGDGQWGAKKAKDRMSKAKLGRNSAHAVDSNLEFPVRMPLSMGVEVAKYGKQNPKGILKLAGPKTLPSSKEMTGRLPSVYQGVDINSRPYGLPLPTPRQKVLGYESGSALRLKNQMRMDDDGDDAEDAIYGVGMQRDPNMENSVMMDKSRLLKAGKKHDVLRSDELATDSFSGFPFSLKNDVHSYGRIRNANQLSDVKAATAKVSNRRGSQEFGKKTKYPENVQQFAGGYQMKLPKGWVQQVKGNRADLSENGEPIWHSKNQGDVFSVDSSLKSEDWSVRRKKWKAGSESPNLNLKSYGSSSIPMNDRILLSELRLKPSQGKIRRASVQNGGPDIRTKKMNRMYARNEETESDSSEQFDDDDDEDEDEEDEEEDNNPLVRSRFSYPTMNPPSMLMNSGLVPKKSKFVKKAMQDSPLTFDGMAEISKKDGGYSELGQTPVHTLKSKQKGKMRDSSPLHSSGIEVLGNSTHIGQGKVKDDNKRRSHKTGKNGQLREAGERVHMSSLKAYPFERKQKGEVSCDYNIDEEEDSLETRVLADENAIGRVGKKGRDRRDRSDASLGGKKRKAKEEITDIDGRDEFIMPPDVQQQMDDSIPVKKKGKRKVEVDIGTSDMEINEPPVSVVEAVEMDIETKPQKKPYTPITPTVHTGFSFSIIHLLSAVRLAMINPHAEDSLEAAKTDEQQNGNHEASTNGVVSLENVDSGKSDGVLQANVPSLTIQEIVNRVRSNPGDPCILETQEPLQDLVRGVLKIFSSKTAPLGAKGWKALVVYEKSTKSWSWIGPMLQSLTDHDTVEEVTSPEYWGLPHKMLVKLVDSFANWLKSGQETLQQIGILPAPPASLMQANLDEKERFRDLRAQKSLHTISPSSEEVRAYFRKEEILRYSIPDRAFSYTAADGKKSIVAPLRRCGGKPTSKARDHFMLKRDRPPHVTILCLVRDAASRLPGSIGTRADVCTLIRDSQYIVEDVSDAQVNQVVSGALDRLHYERDPCVQFDGDRKLWVYLHREREEEDFEDDGTSSTKKWKRQKKDPADQPEQVAVTVAYLGNGDQSGFDLGSDLNVEPPGTADEDKRTDFAYNELKQIVDDNPETSHVLFEADKAHESHPMVWDTLLNPMQDNKLLCQENSTNEDFDDGTFGRERTVGLLSASLL
ncbi:Nuclear factor related to kappa-B-binding protein [Euphorbia peplus]|nr:Nuclear factor related to kappa-B-binding protein [Euphorbia peplus]